MGKLIDETGNTYGYLTVIKRAKILPKVERNGYVNVSVEMKLSF